MRHIKHLLFALATVLTISSCVSDVDDVFDKLDMTRISNLLGMVAGNDFGQIFVTDSNKVRMSGIVDRLTADRTYFEAEGGTFRKS